MNGGGPAARTWHADTTFIARIRAAYLCAVETFGGYGDSRIWGDTQALRANIHEALLADDDSLAPLLADPTSTYLYHGVDNLFPDILDALDSSAENREFFVSNITLMVRRLGEVLGAIPYQNPDGGRPPQSFSIDETLGRIEQKVGVRLSFPSPFPREFGIENARGLIAERALHAIYQAYRVRQLTAAVWDPSVIEIGAGVGRTAYYAHAFGVPDYTIVDLPLTLVGQTLFLTATLGPEAIWLWGEPEPSNRAAIKLCPPAFIEQTREKFHLALNVDSLPEMDRGHAERYMAFAREHCDGLLSINHEANDFAVSDLAPPPSYRFPYALRPGYAEEFYPSPPH